MNTAQEIERSKAVLLDNVQFGVEAKAFVESRIGVFILERAAKDREKAIRQMADVDVRDVAEVQRIQNALNTPNNVLKWLFEAIDEMSLSVEQLRELENSPE